MIEHLKFTRTDGEKVFESIIPDNIQFRLNKEYEKDFLIAQMLLKKD